MNPDDNKGYLPPKIYDKVKAFVLVICPAFSTFYFTFGNIWGFPNVEKVIGSVTALELFLGVVVGVSAKSYRQSDSRFAGDVEYVQDENGFYKPKLMLNDDWDHMATTRKELIFKVKPLPPPPPPDPGPE